MSLRARDIISAIGYPALVGAAVVSVLRSFSGGAVGPRFTKGLMTASSRTDGADCLFVSCVAGLLLVLLQGKRIRDALAWQFLLLAAWCDDDASLQAGGQTSFGARKLQWAEQLELHGRIVFAFRFVNFLLLGCWLYSFAIREINAERSISEGVSFKATPNMLPWFLHSVNAATVTLWLAWWLFKLKQTGSIDWNRRQLVRLRLLGISPVESVVHGDDDTEAERDATDQCAAEWARGTRSAEKAGVANAVLLPESAGPCGLRSSLRPVVVVGNGVLFGCKPVPENLRPSSPEQQQQTRQTRQQNQQLKGRRAENGNNAAVGNLGQLRDCAIECRATWCIVDAPRLSALHCALFRQQGTSQGFVLYDFSLTGCYLNGAPLSAAPALGNGRQVKFGDRISLMVCASPHAEICYTLMPATAASWEWVGRAVAAERATMHSVPRPPASSAAPVHATARSSADEHKRLIEQVDMLQQRKLSYAAQRRMTVPCLVMLAVVLIIALWCVVRVLNCTMLEYVGTLVKAIQRQMHKEVTRQKLHVNEARRLVQPVSILFFWWVLYSLVLALGLLGGWYLLRRAEESCESDCRKAERQLTELLTGSSSSSGASAVKKIVKSAAHEDEVWETQAQNHGLRTLDTLLSQNDSTSACSSTNHETLAVRLSAAMQNYGANGVAPTVAARYTAPHELGLEELSCPISLAQMSTAISVLPCGHVFDRSSLVAYIASANKSSAVARCPFGCECATMTLVTNSYVRKAVFNTRSTSDAEEQTSRSTKIENAYEAGACGSATHQGEYEDDEAVTAIYGSAEMREAYRALLADRSLPAVFECDGARFRQVESLLLHLEGLGWYNPLTHPLADAKTRDIVIGKLQAMLRALSPASADSSRNVGDRWLLQPSRTFVVLTQILRRVLHDADDVLLTDAEEALLGDTLQPFENTHSCVVLAFDCKYVLCVQLFCDCSQKLRNSLPAKLVLTYCSEKSEQRMRLGLL